eukprot:GFUD01017495.1.p1 GENE.GFUD01017495.1~~GFUD01017495.1.p1  ORF type:complete len:754 (+),score=290.72 GFUD01017495.1:38-2299(+)
MTKLWFLLLLPLQTVITRHPLSVRIGGLFDLSNTILPVSLGTSVFILNNSSSILPSTRVDLHTQYSDGDSFSTHQVICAQLQYSVFTIFSGAKHDGVVSDIPNKFHVPHLSTEMVTEKEMKERPFTLYLGPSKEDMTMAVETTVKTLAKTGGKVALISHQTSNLLTSSLLSNLQRDRLDITMEDLVEKDIKPNLVRIRKNNIKTIIVDLAADLVKPFIYQALQAGLLQSGVTLLFTALDFPHLPSISLAQLTGATVLGYSLLADKERNLVSVQSLSSLVHADYRSVLLHDSVLLFGSSLSSLSTSSDPETERLNCSDPDSVSSQGDQMLSHLHSARLEGLTGGISFTDGQRDNLRIHLVRRGEEGGGKDVGVFNTGSKELTLEVDFMEEIEMEGGREKVEVYVMENLENVTGIYDLLTDILEDVSISLQIEIELKHHFGQPSLSTTRMQKLLQDGHLLLLDATTLLSLGEDVAITVPLLPTHGPLLAKDMAQSSLLPPLPWHTWLGLLLSLLLTSLTLSLLSRLSPYQRSHSHLSLLDSLWCVSSALFLSLPHSKLQSVSARLLMLGWSLFCVSSLLLLTLPPHLSCPPVSLPAQSLLYLAGSRQAAQLVQGVTTVLVQRQAQVDTTADRSTDRTDRQEDLLATLHTSFLLLLLLLLSSLVVSLCELVVFSWHNRDSQTVWSALLREKIKTAGKNRTGGDQTGSDLSADRQDGDRSDKQLSLSPGKYQEEDGDCRPDQKLLGQEDEEGQNTRM